MSVGDIIAALIKYASDWDGDKLLLLESIYNIEVHKNDEIEINFVDGNTPDVVIDKNGRKVKLYD